MDKKKLMELAERYQCKADTAFQNYQETGITRYDTARRNNEDMAEALKAHGITIYGESDAEKL